MNSFISICIVLISLFACEAKSKATTTKDKTTEEGSIPVCLQKKIDSIKAQPVWNPPAEVHEYEYDGRRVYSLSADCCDFFSTLYDKNCNYICAPSGGFTGKGDGKCKDFAASAKLIRLVWKDDRVRK